jgi:hypothetical protein
LRLPIHCYSLRARGRFLCPSFRDENRSLVGHQIDNISNTNIAEINSIERVGKFSQEFHVHVFTGQFT